MPGSGKGGSCLTPKVAVRKEVGRTQGSEEAKGLKGKIEELNPGTRRPLVWQNLDNFQ